MPRTTDHTDGFFRRAIILSFNRKFEEHEQDRNLEGDLKPELAGILRWAVEGLQRLNANGQFAIPRSSKAAVARYRVESDPAKLFAEAHLVADTTILGYTATELLHDFNDWCLANGFKSMSVVTFGKRLGPMGFEQHHSGGKNYWRVRYEHSKDDGIQPSGTFAITPPAQKYLV